MIFVNIPSGRHILCRLHTVWFEHVHGLCMLRPWAQAHICISRGEKLHTSLHILQISLKLWHEIVGALLFRQPAPWLAECF